MKNAHMYNSFKIVTGMSAFVKNSAKTEGNITKTSYLNKKCVDGEKGRRTKRITIYAYIFIQFKMDNIFIV